ncbi:unnamed protein product [Protopolystoma xenopodis]|uniref:G domain-containing protein n=1 Tax=Protopolystoma xenopodis TaxID=117903 RepID=A0A3S5CPA9_9PLAT|nr:unnamed protein product [Protopolystoma xenopodis]
MPKPIDRIRLIVLGPRGAGKTSLINALKRVEAGERKLLPAHKVSVFLFPYT